MTGNTPHSARRTVGLLAACQAMLLSNNSTLIAINGLAGLALAPTAALATLPVTCWVVGGALSTMRASLYMRRVGRRRGLMRATGVGMAGALICAAAVSMSSFWLLCLGTLIFGTYNAFGQYYRFVAAEVASADFRATAVSLVLAGGLVGGVVGPTTSRFTIDLIRPHFAGGYLALIGFALVTLALLSRLRLPATHGDADAASGRPLSEIAAQPKFFVAVLSGAIGYGVMNFLMTSTPLAMRACGYPYGDAAFVISSHVVAMFAPSFVTGGLIRRFGVLRVMLAGALLNVACIGIALSGVEVAHFWLSLVMLGVGWNFLYIGGTTLLTESYRPEERARAQGANESAVFAMMVMSSLGSGAIVTHGGWEKVNLAALPLVGIVIAALAWLALKQRPAAA